MLILIPLWQFLRSLWRGLKDPAFRGLLYFVLILLATGMVFYHRTEHWSLLNSLYFSVTTLTTVGFGDFTPHTVAGKVFTMLYIFTGLGTILAFINEISRHVKGNLVQNQPKSTSHSQNS